MRAYRPLLFETTISFATISLRLADAKNNRDKIGTTGHIWATFEKNGIDRAFFRNFFRALWLP